MEMYDKSISKSKKDALEFAEASRIAEWKSRSFVSQLFDGAVKWDIIHPFPEQTGEEKKAGDEYLEKVEKFLKENLNPDEVDRTYEIPSNVMKGLIEMGACAIKIPKQYGGLGFSQMNYNRIIHLIASYCGSTAVLLSAHQSIGVPLPLTLFGTEEQKKKFLPKFRDGAISGFALTEQDAGSDPSKLKTTATPTEDGNYYLLNGSKLWCTNGNVANVIVVMAQTPPKIVDGKERKQITAFIVETNSPGFEVAYRCNFMGLHGMQNGVIKFNNLKVPKENILGEVGGGLKLAFITLDTGRLTLPAAGTGVSKFCLSVARKWAKMRIQWGTPVGEHEMVATKLSKIAANVFAMESIWKLTSCFADDKNKDIRLEAAMAKLFCSETAWK
ncbi:MAG: acyl-CoA dehydrogenase family protein, partial [Elusimicrobiota bacterium]